MSRAPSGFVAERGRRSLGCQTKRGKRPKTGRSSRSVGDDILSRNQDNHQPENETHGGVSSSELGFSDRLEPGLQPRLQVQDPGTPCLYYPGLSDGSLFGRQCGIAGGALGRAYRVESREWRVFRRSIAAAPIRWGNPSNASVAGRGRSVDVGGKSI